MNWPTPRLGTSVVEKAGRVVDIPPGAYPVGRSDTFGGYPKAVPSRPVGRSDPSVGISDATRRYPVGRSDETTS